MAVVLIILAAFFNAVMDTLSHHYERSVFKNLNIKFWNPNVSWQYAKFFPFTKYRMDAWHISKSLMICCLIGLVLCDYYFNAILFYVCMGLIWNTTFNLFYNKILLK